MKNRTPTFTDTKHKLLVVATEIARAHDGYVERKGMFGVQSCRQRTWTVCVCSVSHDLQFPELGWGLGARIGRNQDEE